MLHRNHDCNNEAVKCIQAISELQSLNLGEILTPNLDSYDEYSHLPDEQIKSKIHDAMYCVQFKITGIHNYKGEGADKLS